MDIKQLIKNAYVFRSQAEKFTDSYRKAIDQIKGYFDSNHLREFKVDDMEVPLLAKVTERVTIDYSVEKLQQKLEPEIMNEIIRKTYVVNDMPGLVSLLKNAGVKPADFKKFIQVEQEVDKPTIRRLYETGDITKENLKGCFTAKVVKSIKISPQKDA